ncbi:hypothetical protein, partial [Flavobacterium sp.]|uniref:DUF6943 family protein n=1 Tax=Flavobacterium sp. TaxID=239 RepID=UPI0025B8B3B7
NTQYANPHFFVLNKGQNSGKPQNEPFTNSFVLVFQTEEQKENVYWIAMSLWKSNFWHQHLKGSVIPFISIYEFKNEFNPKVTRVMREHEQHLKNVQALKLLQEKENNFNKNIHLINEIRSAILLRYRLK